MKVRCPKECKCTHVFTAYTHHEDEKYYYVWCGTCNHELNKVKKKIWEPKND